MLTMTDKTREPGTVHRVKKSRGTWHCAECPTVLGPGASYMFLNTHDERTNTWSRYILCSECERIRSCFTVAELALDSHDSYRAGHLRQEVRERSLIDNDFHHEYQIAWLASSGTDEGSE
jgi:hypothetical protein